MRFAHRLWPSEGSDINKCETGNSIASIWMSYRLIKMAAAAAQYYFRFCICWYRCFHKVKVYEQTKFRRHISIDGWDITTSVFEKQTSAILEIYFRFRFRPFARNLQGVNVFSKSRMCQYPGMLCYILWIQKCIFDACRLSLHNSTPSHCTTLAALRCVYRRCRKLFCIIHNLVVQLLQKQSLCVTSVSYTA